MISTKVFCFLTILVVYVAAGLTKDKPKAVVTIQATNQTLVPNIVYTVDAVECLKEAYSIYVDEPSRAEAYRELYTAKYPGNWNVAIGYTTIITNSSIYVECLVDAGKDDDFKLKKDSKPTGVLYRIFN